MSDRERWHRLFELALASQSLRRSSDCGSKCVLGEAAIATRGITSCRNLLAPLCNERAIDRYRVRRFTSGSNRIVRSGANLRVWSVPHRDRRQSTLRMS